MKRNDETEKYFFIKLVMIYGGRMSKGGRNIRNTNIFNTVTLLHTTLNENDALSI